MPYKARMRRPIEVRGDIAIVPLTQGKVAVIDAADVPLISDRSWCAALARNGRWEAVASRVVSRHKLRLLMHRVILGAPEGLEVDHINHDTLNNRRSNLRVCTLTQNHHNRRKSTNPSTSPYKGVSFHRGRRKWAAVIDANGKHEWLGSFRTPEAAAYVYDAAARRLHGEFALLNFPQDWSR